MPRSARGQIFYFTIQLPDLHIQTRKYVDNKQNIIKNHFLDLIKNLKIIIKKKLICN